MPKYNSTRGEHDDLRCSEAIIKGIAGDRGLYVPDTIPVPDFEIVDLAGASYKEIAKKILGLFFDDFTDEEIESCVNGAYDSKFDDPSIAPIKEAGGAYFLELYHGKTAAFKDMALSILPYFLTASMKKEKEDKKVVILTATPTAGMTSMFAERFGRDKGTAANLLSLTTLLSIITLPVVAALAQMIVP